MVQLLRRGLQFTIQTIGSHVLGTQGPAGVIVSPHGRQSTNP